MPRSRQIALLALGAALGSLGTAIARGLGPPADDPPRPAGRFSERVDVSLHLIDVAVVDRRGRPVRGLTAEDFTARVDGEPREIRSFDPASARRLDDPGARPDSRGGRAGQRAGGRWIVVLLDGERIAPQYREIALETARAVVARADQARDRVAVASLSGAKLEYLVEFSPPPNAMSALRSIPRPARPAPDVDDLVDAVAPCRNDGDPAACVVHAAEEFLHEKRRRVPEAIDALTGLVRALAPLPGRKALFLFSRGLLLQPGEVVLDAAAATGSDAEPLRSLLEDPYPLEFEELIAAATRARVSIFALRTGYSDEFALVGGDIGGHSVRGGPRAIASPHRTAARSVEHGLRTLAEATGGRAVFRPLGRRAATGLLERLDGVYTIGISPVAGDTLRSRVDVDVLSKGARVQMLGRLTRRTAAPKTLTGSLQAEFADASVTAQRIDLVIQLSPEGLSRGAASAGVGTQWRAAIYTQVLTDTGERVEDDYRVVEFAAPGESPAALQHRIGIRVGPGSYSARVRVSDLLGPGSTDMSTRFSLAPPVTRRVEAGNANADAD